MPSETVTSPYARVLRRRTCLGCGKRFDSEGAWNRRCPDCDRRLTETPARAARGRYRGSGSGKEHE